MSQPTRFEEKYCSLQVSPSGTRDVVVRGVIKELVKDNVLYFAAASPPDYRYTYTGSGLPFASEEQAFDNTPNVGRVTVNNGKFEIQLMYPNSYMIGLGSVTVPPTLFLEYVDAVAGETRHVQVKLSEGIPYRMLTYPYKNCARKDAMFYSNHGCLPVRSQEAILRSAGFPSTNTMPKNHWGLKPSV